MMMSCISAAAVVAVARASAASDSGFVPRRESNPDALSSEPEIPDEVTFWRLKHLNNPSTEIPAVTEAPEIPDEETYWRLFTQINGGVSGGASEPEPTSMPTYELPDESTHWNLWSLYNNVAAPTPRPVVGNGHWFESWSGWTSTSGSGAGVADENDYWRKWSAVNFQGSSGISSGVIGRRRLDGGDETDEFSGVDPASVMSWNPMMDLSDEEVSAFSEEAMDHYQDTSEDMQATFEALTGKNPWHDVILAVIRFQIEEDSYSDDSLDEDPLVALARIFRAGLADPVAHFRECENLLRSYIEHVSELDDGSVQFSIGDDESDDSVHVVDSSEVDAAGIPSDGVGESDDNVHVVDSAEVDSAGIPADGIHVVDSSEVDPAGIPSDGVHVVDSDGVRRRLEASMGDVFSAAGTTHAGKKAGGPIGGLFDFGFRRLLDGRPDENFSAGEAIHAGKKSGGPIGGLFDGTWKKAGGPIGGMFDFTWRRLLAGESD